ncbi:hypothetical protein BJ875DRAFT_340659, partial [Amylocarpus encephaloides]
TSTPREACDTKAKVLMGGEVVPIVQDNYSDSVYARPKLEFVVQSLMLKSEIVALAQEIYGSLASDASFHGQV